MISKGEIILFLFLLYSLSSYSQGEWNTWYFGDKAGVSFNSGTPVSLTNSAVIATVGTISISDSMGNFLFYSDAGRVWDRNFNVMPNGNFLNCSGTGTPEDVYCFPFINDDSTYYLWTTDRIEYPYNIQTCGLRYSILNMRLNNNLGDIEPSQKDIPVPGAFGSAGLLHIHGRLLVYRDFMHK
jgi:hypothetical protein